jgi:O-methyltransferase
MSLTTLRRRFVGWVIRHHPGLYLRRMGAGRHLVEDDSEFWNMHAGLVEEGRGVHRWRERHNLWMLARSVARLPGDFAEVGVYQGGSARVLAESSNGAGLHLFDTFAGMPRSDSDRDGGFVEGDFADTSLQAVQNFLARYSGVRYYAGRFPATADALPDGTRFKLVHLDADLHASTLAGLEFFYPRLVRGGVLVAHDYNDPTVPGVRAAFDAFMPGKPETLIELWDTQCAFVKI